MRFDVRIIRSIPHLAVLFLFLALTACAPTSAIIIDDEVVTNPKPMYTYKSLIINDLELKRELYGDSGEADMGRREKRYASLPVELSDHIERFVTSRRTYRTVLRAGDILPTTLVLKGSFTRVGRFRISIIVRLVDGSSGQEVAHFRQTLWDVLDSTENVRELGREVAEFIDRIQYK
jgi:hypothetical protein